MADREALQLTVIQPRKGLFAIDLPEVWRYRDLLWILALRDIKVRYKQTIIGVAWALLQPLMVMVVFSVIFGHFAKIPSDGLPYPLFAFAALLPWQMFSNALTQSSNSVVENERLITKIYFPRLIIPLASVGAGLADFAVSLVFLLLMLAYYGVMPGWQVLAIPLLTVFALLAAFSVGIWLAALNSLYRDFRYTVPFLLQCWMFVSPVAYPSSMIDEKWRWLYGLNPMAGVIEGFRWALLNAPAPSPSLILASLFGVSVLLASGVVYFKRMERTFADWV